MSQYYTITEIREAFTNFCDIECFTYQNMSHKLLLAVTLKSFFYFLTSYEYFIVCYCLTPRPDAQKKRGSEKSPLLTISQSVMKQQFDGWKIMQKLYWKIIIEYT